ncbi:MAG: hypothetical protein O2798_09215 [Chloroflexi bacterium]|nr:hypothetical protein [Chloroflexota bacterium]MDA1241005.1 hypothetical protein [Chloroflexota bacterium]
MSDERQEQTTTGEMREAMRRSTQFRTHMLFAEGVSVGQVWPFVLAAFVGGGLSTAMGLTVAASDTLILVGMTLTGIAVVSMWLPGKGAIRWQTFAVMLAFVSGSACTAMALTVNPSNELLLLGMVLTSVGIAGMWGTGRVGRLPLGVCAFFVSGTSIQATGLTLMPSDFLVMAGMVLVSSSIFGMWFVANRT